MKNIYLILIISVLVLGCSDTFEKLKRVGKQPELGDVEIPPEPIASTLKSDSITQEYKRRIKATNSLWLPGATTFFFSSRAWRIGDIIKVIVLIKDSAQLNNSTRHLRNGKDSLSIPNVFGQEKAISTFLSNRGDPNSLLNTKGQMNHLGSGDISRKEDIKTEIAAIVKRVLPNGNLIIQGRQEVRVNYELREVKVIGIIRPKDISANNSINSDQIAEARISYGGRGIVSDVQQPRVGSQVLDILSPF